jgi:hypothetical protein
MAAPPMLLAPTAVARDRRSWPLSCDKPTNVWAVCAHGVPEARVKPLAEEGAKSGMFRMQPSGSALGLGMLAVRLLQRTVSTIRRPAQWGHARPSKRATAFRKRRKPTQKGRVDPSFRIARQRPPKSALSRLRTFSLASTKCYFDSTQRYCNSWADRTPSSACGAALFCDQCGRRDRVDRRRKTAHTARAVSRSPPRCPRAVRERCYDRNASRADRNGMRPAVRCYGVANEARCDCCRRAAIRFTTLLAWLKPKQRAAPSRTTTCNRGSTT